MTRPHRYSDFWLNGGHLTQHPEGSRPEPEPPEPKTKPPSLQRYQYAVEYAHDGPIVHRFPEGSERAAWLAEDMVRRVAVPASHRLVGEAKRAGQWSDEV